MTTLLTLIPELRSRILECALSIPRSAPQSFDDISNRTTNKIIDFKSWSGQRDVLYEPLNRVDLIPLLLVNKQIHAETLAAIERIPTKHSYVLDIVFHKETVLLPTWLSLPQLSSSVDSIHATIRYIGISETPFSAFQGGDGSPPRLYWLFYSLLECVLRGGVVGNSGQVVTVKHLEINIQSPVVTEDMIAQFPNRAADRSQASLNRKLCPGKPQFMNPARIIRAVQFGMITLLSLHRDACELGKLLYGSVDIVRLLVDGEVRREWKMGELLGNMTGENYRKGTESDREEFKMWKSYISEKRVERGLSVAETIEDQQ